jgi:pre-rRNA-processing protein TSR4
MPQIAPVSWLTDFAYMPDKVGGKPTWLIPENTPFDELRCVRCSKPMPLLLQIHAPLSQYERTFHRMLYVFCCRNGACHFSEPMGCFHVLRSQLEGDNPYYLPKTEDELLRDPDGAEYNYKPPPNAWWCEECGFAASKRCAGCKKAHYCSKEHQISHWNRLHKAQCSQLGTPAPKNTSPQKEEQTSVHLAPSPLLFDEWEIVTEEESQQPQTDETLNNIKDKLASKFEHLLAAKPEPTEENESEQNINCQVDNSFLKFQQRITGYEDQILRYSRDPTVVPLWVSDKGQAQPSDIPPCEYCGGPRTFEFQIMPQLLHFLHVERVERDWTEKAIDWGTLAIYTCAQSCDSKLPYCKEFLWRQMAD